jgi:hypothetical protein
MMKKFKKPTVYLKISIAPIGSLCDVCHAITVTKYRFAWCSVDINVSFNTCFGNIICYIGKFYFENIFNCRFELFWENCMIIIATGQIYSNYELSRFFK